MVLVKDTVVDFLTEVGETEGGPYATWFIRQLTCVGLWNCDSEVIELPSWLTKRKLHCMFMYQEGVIAKADAKRQLHHNQTRRQGMVGHLLVQ